MKEGEIYETENFIVLRVLRYPHISREEGGHIIIKPKIDVSDRTELSPKLAVELMRITMVSGEAMATALSRRGINIGRINYQDNGNWSVFKPGGPHMHIHLYGRAKDAKIQKYGDACSFPHIETGFYDSFKPLNNEDGAAIKQEIEEILLQEKYQDKNWVK